MNPITVQLNLKTTGADPKDPVQMQLVIVPAAEVESLKKQVETLQLQNTRYERQLDSLRERFHELVQLFGDIRKGRF